MCGVFGFVGQKNRTPSVRRLEEMAVATERRGPHAFGFAWIDGRGRLKMFKQSGRISDALGLLAMASDAQMLIGHCRYATHGDPDNNLNNHPHSVDGGWLVHNGVIHGHKQIVEQHDLAPVTHCDSEVLGLLIPELDGSLVERCIRAAQICGSGPLAMLALWRSPQRLVAIRRGNPLHLAEHADGYYFASLKPGLPKSAICLRDNVALNFSQKSGETKLTAYDADEVVTIGSK